MSADLAEGKTYSNSADTDAAVAEDGGIVWLRDWILVRIA